MIHAHFLIMNHRVEDTLADYRYVPALRHYTEGDFDGYHAAPLLIVGPDADPELVERQDELAWRMVDAAYGEVAAVAKPSVAMFAARSTIGRMHQREGMNGISYMHRRFETPRVDQVPDVDPAFVLEACTRALRGQGTPIQNDIARRADGRDTAEIANLTIFNTFRKNLEPHMWQAVSELVGHDATPRSDQMYGLRILGMDRMLAQSQHLGAVRIGMKRHIAELDDGTLVKARTTAIINVSPSSGFDQDIIERFRSVAGEKNAFERMSVMPEFQRAIGWLIDTPLSEALVLARNETVYEVAPSNRKV